jgi:hypothetical protein
MLRFYSPTEKCTVTTRRRKNEISECISVTIHIREYRRGKFKMDNPDIYY